MLGADMQLTVYHYLTFFLLLGGGLVFLALLLYFTGDINNTDCVERFSMCSYVQKLYDEAADPEEHPWGKLTNDLDSRYHTLIHLLKSRPDLIEGRGNFEAPAFPTYTSCRLTDAGLKLAPNIVAQFPRKPDFPDWPDKRTMPGRSDGLI